MSAITYRPPVMVATKIWQLSFKVRDQLRLEARDQGAQLGIEQVTGSRDQAITIKPDGHAAISQDADNLLGIGHQNTSQPSSVPVGSSASK